jgi:uncharacterized membrane protein YdjX (TVP38/TMEM64 family)
MSRRQLLLLGALLLALGAFVGFDLGRFLSLEHLKATQAGLAAHYAQHPLQVLATFFCVYVLATAVSIPGAGTALTLAAGALFGLWVGLLLVSFASTLGALLAMLSARYVLRDLVVARFGQRVAAIDAGMARDGAFYLFSLRLVPLFPYFLVNLLMGITNIPARTFWVATQLGMLTGTALYVNAGTQLARIESLRGLISPGVLGSLAMLGLLPLLARKALAAWQVR